MSIWSSADTARIVQLAFEIIFISLVIALNFCEIEVFTSGKKETCNYKTFRINYQIKKFVAIKKLVYFVYVQIK